MVTLLYQAVEYDIVIFFHQQGGIHALCGGEQVVYLHFSKRVAMVFQVGEYMVGVGLQFIYIMYILQVFIGFERGVVIVIALGA